MTIPEYRFIGVFGHREMELAAIVIVDAGVLRKAIDPNLFTDKGEYERIGFIELQHNGWIVRHHNGTYRATRDFIRKCEEARP